MTPKLLTIFTNPKLNLVLDRAKLDIAESIYFHSSDLNHEVYNYSSQVFNKNKLKKEVPKQLNTIVKQTQTAVINTTKEAMQFIV